VVKVWLDIVFWLGLLGGVVLAGWTLISPLVMAGSGRAVDLSVPVAVGSGSLLPVEHLRTPDETADAGTPALTRPRLVKTRGELRFDASSWGLQAATNLGMLVGIALVLYVIFLVRGVVATVITGNPFVPENARRIRLIGMIVIAAGIVGPFAEYVAARAVLARITIEGITLSPPAPFRTDPILAGLLVWVLAAVFERGAALEKEQSLTV
jgi:hypothetical protein